MPAAHRDGEDGSRVADERTFAGVLEGLRPRLAVFARHRGVIDADDLVQETLLAALVAFRHGAFRGQSTIDAWIYGILRKKISDYYRTMSLESTYLLSCDSDAFTPHSKGVTVESCDRHIALGQALASLPARHRRILILHWRQGLKTREIAPLFRLSAGRTGAILAEAKQMLRQRISGLTGSVRCRGASVMAGMRRRPD
jgi:RNA polymerase sigma factor (sigma-70 family)